MLIYRYRAILYEHSQRQKSDYGGTAVLRVGISCNFAIPRIEGVLKKKKIRKKLIRANYFPDCSSRRVMRVMLFRIGISSRGWHYVSVFSFVCI